MLPYVVTPEYNFAAVILRAYHICVDPCFHGAIELKSHKLVIHKDKCDGCGLCIISCPRDAIKMLNVDKFLDMYLKRELNKPQTMK